MMQSLKVKNRQSTPPSRQPASKFMEMSVTIPLLSSNKTLSKSDSFGLLERIQLLFRRIYVFRIGLGLFLGVKLTQKRIKWFHKKSTEEEKDKIWDETHESLSVLVTKAIVSMEGLWIKAGQYLSTRGDVLPANYVDKFKAFQDSVPRKPTAHVIRTICSELQITDLKEVFESFDETPLATASIAQVHRAVLRPEYGGGEVVVKVQHRNVGQRVLQDLADLKLLMAIVAYFEPDYDFTPIVSEWSSEVPKELDFQTEAKNTIEVRDAISEHNKKGNHTSNDDPLYINVSFPDPVLKLTTKKIMVMNYINGFKMLQAKEMKAAGADVDDIVKHIVRAYAFQLYTISFWNADPHPGNFLVSKDGTDSYRAALLDFGLCKRATRDEAIALCRCLLSARNLDFAGLLASFKQLGFESPVDDPDKAMELIQFVFRRTTSIEETKAAAKERSEKRQKDYAEDRERIKKEKEEAKKAGLKKPKESFPGVLIFFGRVISLLRGLCLELETRQSHLEIMAPFAELLLTTLAGETGKYGKLLDMPAPLSKLDARLRVLVKDLIDQKQILGVQVHVIQKGKIVANLSAGVQGVYDPQPVLENTVFPVFSCSKGITASAANLLISRGYMKPSDLVIKHWPTFASRIENEAKRAAKERTTIAHLLSHRAGLEDAGNAIQESDPFKMTSWETMLESMELSEPADGQPGGKSSYHFLSFGWLVGGVCEKVLEALPESTKLPKTFKDLVRHEVLDNVGVGEYGYLGIPSGIENRLGANQWDLNELKQMMIARGMSPAMLDGIDAMLSGTSTEISMNMPNGSADTMAATGNGVVPVTRTSTELNGHPLQASPPAQSNGVANGSTNGAIHPKPGSGIHDVKTTASPNLFDNADPDTVQQQQTANLSQRLRSRNIKVNPVAANPTFFNHLRIRRSVIPAASGNFSAAGLSTLYQHFIDCQNPSYTGTRLYTSEDVTTMYAGDAASGIPSTNDFGYGFKKYPLHMKNGELSTGFGHGGLGGSLAFVDLTQQVSIAVVVSKLSIINPVATRAIVSCICEELELGVLAEYEGKSSVRFDPDFA
ncbi:hypothetical protein SmJEL517_g01339 [Synchytrium microbalum]|uniref:ABC1 atypical kinase-like domain-containing protein n=1 Tax=Synchytrium microbalum TaxID=1806994 RepID=A0A507CFZ8_9FUNG|nr:uncharacterized protein SmJEL517_g01339 [Synchytrium microbalum]TPX36505.1 hypothetical protein SmJEL517_g01339 [Synchytrium microbalum]